MADTVDLINQDEEEVWPLTLPSLCPTCWGCDHALQFIKEDIDKKCKICDWKFKVVKWSPIPDDTRQIEICSFCSSKLGNICQLCGESCPPKIERKTFYGPRRIHYKHMPKCVIRHTRVLSQSEQAMLACRRNLSSNPAAARAAASAAIVPNPPTISRPLFKRVLHKMLSAQFQYPY